MGYTTGSFLSVVNFWAFHRLVDKVGQQDDAGGPPRSASAIFFGARYLAFVMAGYVIVKYFEASVMAALAGCFVAVAAVVLEIIYELVYAGTS